MSDGSAGTPPQGDGGGQGAPGGKPPRAYSDHPEAVKARRKRNRRALRKALAATPVPARPATPTADKMATTKLLESGVIRRARAGRMYEVEQMMLAHAPTMMIVRRITNSHGCSEDQVFEDMKILKPEIARALDQATRVPADLKREADRAVLVDLKHKAEDAGDLATARLAWQDVCRIDGAFAPIRVDVRVQSVTDAEAIESARRLTELLGQSERRIIDAKSSEATPDGPVRVLPAPEEMH